MVYRCVNDKQPLNFCFHIPSKPIINLSLVSSDTIVLTKLDSVLRRVDSSPDTIVRQNDVDKPNS